MWIELQNDIEEYLSDISCAMDKAALAINALFDSMLKGQHIIFATRKLLSRIQELDYINPSNRDFICWIKQKYVYLYECRDIVKYKIKVTSKVSSVIVEDNVYEVPLEYFYDIRESKLLTENESDGKFFEDIFNYVRNKGGMSRYFDIKFENDSCHGANVSSKIMQNSKDNRIALCILDSDREMKNAKTGATYKGANKSYKKVKENNIMLLEALKVREKENLFPPSLYMIVCEKNKTLLDVLNLFVDDEKIIGYFDIKDGIKYNKYQIDGWEEYYKNVIEKLEEKGEYKFPSNDDEKNKEFVCIAGIGEKACETICKLLLEDENMCKETIKINNLNEDKRKIVWELRNNMEQNIPDYLYEEWKYLHNILFSWGCCISKNNLPMYQI